MPTNTLTQISAAWPNFQFSSFAVSVIRADTQKGLTVGASKSGGGMVLLLGLEVLSKGDWHPAHISLPPGSQGMGYVEEGHLKIEGGHLLNQYFFTVEDPDAWEIEKAANSPTVATRNPGKWDQLDAKVWSDFEKLVTKLLFA